MGEAGVTLQLQVLRGDIVVLALPYGAAAPVLKQYGDGLAGKTIIDITNPIDTATFAGLVTPPDSSGAQEIAKVATGANVVKAFNTIFAGTLVAGEVGGQPLDVWTHPSGIPPAPPSHRTACAEVGSRES